MSEPKVDNECVCRGNWRALVAETMPLIGCEYRDGAGNLWVFFGLVHGGDDYYYGMSSRQQLVLLSCVADIEGHGWERISAIKALEN